MLTRPDDKKATVIDLTRCYAASDRQQGISRRTQALLAAAGMDEPTRKWFVITVDPGMDHSVSQRLRQSGVEVWSPAVWVMPPRRGGMPKKSRKPVEKLAMRGYLFVKVAATNDAWSGLSTVKGFAGMLGNCGRPIIITDAEVALFKAYLTDDPEAAATVVNKFRLGDPITITSGPMRSFPGVLEAIDEERGRVIVELMIFGRSNPVHLDIAQIKKL